MSNSSHTRTIREALEHANRAESAEAFCEQHPQPVFVFGAFASMQDCDFFTLDGEGQGLGLRVIDVSKRSDSNAFGSMITIGRARNNDVPLRQNSVSKFHAYLTREGGESFLVDAGSTYGTRVNGTKLADRGALCSGDVVQLGRLQLTYYEPAAFYQILESALTAQPYDRQNHTRSSA